MCVGHKHFGLLTLAKNHKVKTERTLLSQEDLSTLVCIYKRQQRHKEALETIQQFRRGPYSDLGIHSWEINLQLIELQGRCDQWESQWLTCSNILRAARPEKFKLDQGVFDGAYGARGDDWNIWNRLVVATNNIFPNKPE